MTQARCAFVLILVVLFAIVATDAQETLRFSDLAGTTTLVYPAGPNVTVINPQALPSVEVWVVRDLDGAVVRTYPVTGRSIWKQVVEVQAEGRDEPLENLVQGQNVTLRFLLFLVGPDREIQETYRFMVRRNAPRSAPTSPTSYWREPGRTYAYLASGKLEAIKGDEVVLSPWQGGNVFKVASNSTTNVSESGGKFAEWTWPQAKESLKTGDQVTILYTEKDGKKVARELVVATPPRLPSIASVADPLAGLRFQIGTVVSAKEDAVAPAKAHDLIVETKSGTRRWRISDTSRIMRGAVEGKRSDLSPTALIAVGARKLTGSEVLAEHVLVLKDLTGNATR